MSGLRETHVAISMQDGATSTLNSINRLMDRIGNNFRSFGNNVDDSTSGFRDVFNEVNRLNRNLNDSTEEITSLNRRISDSGSEMTGLRNESRRLETELRSARDEMQTMQARIVQAESEMARLRNEVNRVNSTASRTTTIFGGMAGKVTAVVGALSIAGIALGVSIASTAIEMDTAFSRLEARTGATGAELKGLEGVAKDVFTSGFGESISQASDSVATFSAMFRDLGTGDLTNVVKGASTIAETWDYEAKEVGRAVQSMSNNFDGLGEAKALDLMTHAFQKTGDYSDDLLDTFSEYSMHFSKVGLSAEEFTGILINGAESGAWNLDKVGDSMKEFGIRAIDGSKTTAEGFAAIGFKADDMADKFIQGGETANNAFVATLAGLSAMKDPVAQNAAGVALFGTQWEDVREDVILSMADSTSAVKGFEGATGRASEALKDNFGSRMTNVWRDLKIGMAEAFQNPEMANFLSDVMGDIESAVPSIKRAFTEFANVITNNVQPAYEGFKTGLQWTLDNKEPLIAALAGVAGGFAALKAITLVKAALDLYKNSTLIATFATQGFNAVLKANPIGLVVTAIGLLVAAGVYLYRNWDTVRAKTGELWSKLGAFKGVATLVLGPLGQIIRTAVTMAENWDSTKSVWENVWNGIKLAASNAVNDVIGSINGMIGVINKIPGIDIPIVPKVDWGETKSIATKAKTFGSNKQENPGLMSAGDLQSKTFNIGSLDGNHATGLESVPYDGYTAELHEGESVLTSKQSNALRNAGMLTENSDGTPSLNMGGGNNGGSVQQESTANTNSGGNQFIFQISGENAGDIAQKVREVISDILGEEMQLT